MMTKHPIKCRWRKHEAKDNDAGKLAETAATGWKKSRKMTKKRRIMTTTNSRTTTTTMTRSLTAVKMKW